MIYANIYNNAPIVIQNLLTSIYGRILHARRYGGAYINYYNYISKSQWFNKYELLKLQNKKLSSLIQHAYNNVPYYHEVFEQNNICPDEIKSSNDLIKIPVLTRTDIFNNKIDLVARNYRRKRLLKHHTSGTTGSPLEFFLTHDTFRANYAHWMRFREWFGFKPWYPRATFGGRIIVPRKQNAPPFCRYNKIENQLIFSSFHLSDENLPFYIERLTSFSPYVIEGYVSSIYTIAKYINKNNISIVRPKAIQTTSETLLPHHRKEIEEAFRCKVYNQYGHGECAAFISECEEGRLHINDEYGIVEIMKEGQPAMPGELGEIIVTGFYNQAMPLIRYQTGDLAVQGDRETCKCGRGLSTIQSIEGRILDIIHLADGNIVPPTALTLLFDKASVLGVETAQIIQKSVDHFIIKIVPRYNLNEKKLNTLRDDLKTMVGAEATVNFDVVRRIEKTSSGKYKFVISEVEQ